MLLHHVRGEQTALLDCISGMFAGFGQTVTLTWISAHCLSLTTGLPATGPLPQEVLQCSQHMCRRTPNHQGGAVQPHSQPLEASGVSCSHCTLEQRPTLGQHQDLSSCAAFNKEKAAGGEV